MECKWNAEMKVQFKCENKIKQSRRVVMLTHSHDIVLIMFLVKKMFKLYQKLCIKEMCRYLSFSKVAGNILSFVHLNNAN